MNIDPKFFGYLGSNGPVRERRYYIFRLITETNSLIIFSDIVKKVCEKYTISERTAYNDLRKVNEVIARMYPDDGQKRLHEAELFIKQRIKAIDESSMTEYQKEMFRYRWARLLFFIFGLGKTTITHELKILEFELEIPSRGLEAGEQWT